MGKKTSQLGIFFAGNHLIISLTKKSDFQGRFFALATSKPL